MPGDVSEHFNYDEFFSPNDKGPTFWTKLVKAELILTLEAIRREVDKPIRIESGIRSVEYNASLKGSAPNSGHLSGEAADIRVAGLSNKELGRIIRTMQEKGRLPYLRYSYLIAGSTNTSVHIGVDVKPRKSIWGSGY